MAERARTPNRRGTGPTARKRRGPDATAPESAPGWFVYLLRCSDRSLYTGIARDVAARLEAHRSGRGARYTRGRGPLTVVHVEPARSRGEAQRREAAIRRLRRAEKEALAAAWRGEPPAGPSPAQRDE